jgi:cytochrome c biogenesis protein CcmG/thiol:disulfide interchange protein DsbE
MESVSETPSTASLPESASPRSIRWGRLVAWFVLFVLLTILAFGLLRSQQGPVGRGEQAPAFILTTFGQEEIDSADLAGKVIVINFWASWCKPCEQEAADLQTAWEQHAPGEEVVFLGVDYVDTETEARAYLSKFGITYPNGPDLGTRISQSFRIQGVPETYFIDRTGQLTYVKKGPFLSLGEIQAVIEPLLEP